MAEINGNSEFAKISSGEAVSSFKQFSEKTSDIVRNLAISGVVISWFFFTNFKATNYDTWFLLPMLFFVLSLIFDFYQYAKGKSIFHAADLDHPQIRKTHLARITAHYENKKNTLVVGYVVLAVLMFIKFGIPKSLQMEGNTYNALTNQPISATIIYESLPDHIKLDSITSGDNNGAFYLNLKKDKNYYFIIKKDGFATEVGYLKVDSIPKEDYQKIYKVYFLQPVFVNNDNVHYNIYFDVNNSYLRPESYAPVNTIISLLKEDPSLKIEIISSTDNSGNRLKNIILGEQRYTAVASYLISRGINSNRIVCKNFGPDSSITSNNTYEGKQLNRRVTLKILKK